MLTRALQRGRPRHCHCVSGDPGPGGDVRDWVAQGGDGGRGLPLHPGREGGSLLRIQTPPPACCSTSGNFPNCSVPDLLCLHVMTLIALLT